MSDKIMNIIWQITTMIFPIGLLIKVLIKIGPLSDQGLLLIFLVAGLYGLLFRCKKLQGTIDKLEKNGR